MTAKRQWFIAAISGLSVAYFALINFLDRHFGSRIERRDPEVDPRVGSVVEPHAPEDLTTKDASAVQAAKLYRGVGVAVAILSLAIVLIELTPPAANAELFLLSTKVGLMLALLGLVAWAIRKDLRGKFIRERAAAERCRFAVIKAAVDTGPTPASLGEIQRLLGEQRRYHECRARRFRSMTWVCNRATWVLFVFVVLGNLGRLLGLVSFPSLTPAAELAVPVGSMGLAVLAAIQSVNAFLRIEGQRHEARALATYLQHAMKNEHPSAGELQAIYDVLMQHEQQWVTQSQRGGSLKVVPG